jgi:hypothetical protein
MSDALTDEEADAADREKTAKELSRKMLKVITGYDGAAAVMAIALVLQHIARTAE